MLLSKAVVEVGKVYGFKLVTNEEVIGKLIGKQGGEYSLEEPHALVMSQDGAGLAPWPMSAKLEQNAAIPFSAVVAVYVPREDFAEGYKKSTSKIVTPSSNIIV